jgi:hypothetical protein
MGCIQHQDFFAFLLYVVLSVGLWGRFRVLGRRFTLFSDGCDPFRRPVEAFSRFGPTLLAFFGWARPFPSAYSDVFAFWADAFHFIQDLVLTPAGYLSFLSFLPAAFCFFSWILLSPAGYLSLFSFLPAAFCFFLLDLIVSGGLFGHFPVFARRNCLYASENAFFRRAI